MITLLKSVARDDKGVAMVEYGLLLALISMVCLVAITAIGTNLKTVFTTLSGSI